MKTIEDIKKKKISIVRIDNSLEKYKTMPIFQDKGTKQNEVLTVGPSSTAEKLIR